MINFIQTFIGTITFFLFFLIFIYIIEKILFCITKNKNKLFEVWKKLKKFLKNIFKK